MGNESIDMSAWILMDSSSSWLIRFLQTLRKDLDTKYKLVSVTWKISELYLRRQWTLLCLVS